MLAILSEHDTDGDGTLDFGEFRTAMLKAQEKRKSHKHKDEMDMFEQRFEKVGKMVQTESAFVTYLLNHC